MPYVSKAGARGIREQVSEKVLENENAGDIDNPAALKSDNFIKSFLFID